MIDSTEDGVPSVHPLLYRPEEAAAVLGLGRSTVFELLAAGEIASVRIGRARRISHAALEAFVERIYADQPTPAA